MKVKTTNGISSPVPPLYTSTDKEKGDRYRRKDDVIASPHQPGISIFINLPGNVFFQTSGDYISLFRQSLPLTSGYVKFKYE